MLDLVLWAVAVVLLACFCGILGLAFTPLRAYSKSWRGPKRIRAVDLLGAASTGTLVDQLQSHYWPRDELWMVGPRLPHIIVVQGSPRALRAARLLCSLTQD